MPSIVQRSESKSGLVLLESRVAVADDGLVTIEARFLAPISGVPLGSFEQDALWPAQVFPAGVPKLQGGPYLRTYSAQKQNGLTFIEATYLSAVNPVRIATSTATERLSFSGFAETSTAGPLGSASASGSLSFDYYTTSVTQSYTLIAPNIFSAPVNGQIGVRFNIRTEGQSSLVTTNEEEFVTQSVEVLGAVSRVTRTVRRIIVQGETPQIQLDPFRGATINGTQLFNPWSVNAFGI
jgi:hypothetical protein